MLEYGNRFIVIGSHSQDDSQFLEKVQSIASCQAAVKAMIVEVYALANRYISMISDGKFDCESSTEEPNGRIQNENSLQGNPVQLSDSSLQIMGSEQNENKNAEVSKETPDWIRFVSIFTRKIAICLKSYQDDIILQEFRKICRTRLFRLAKLKQYIDYHPKVSTQTLSKKFILNVVFMLTENPEYLQEVAMQAKLWSIPSKKISLFCQEVQKVLNSKKIE